MTPSQRVVVAAVTGAALLSLALFAGSCAALRVRAIAPPDDAAERWAERALAAAIAGEPSPPAPASAEAYRAAGKITVAVHVMGEVVLRSRVHEGLVAAVEAASRTIAADPAAAASWLARTPQPRVTVPLGYAPTPMGPALLESVGLVPVVEGLEARHGDDSAALTPDDLLSEGAFDRGTPTPIPDLRVGVPIEELRASLVATLGVDATEAEDVSLLRFRAHAFGGGDYPDVVPVTEETLRQAAVEGARFLLRHQLRDGSYTYNYDGVAGRGVPSGYSIPRHSGTTYFLAQADHLHGMPEARAGAIKALEFLRRHHLARCGSDEVLCIRGYGDIVDVGSAALTVVAAAELIAKEPHPLAIELTQGLTAFLRAQQRPDGELMHEYDLVRGAPIDVQHMYYSGEAALAFFAAHEALGDPRDLEAGKKLMAHLAGAGWDFLGSRYYYGEEHWTCIAAGEAGDRVPTEAVGDLCARWLRFNDAIQFRDGETPWSATGAFGVGPLIVPMLTPVASRTEAFVSAYDLIERSGGDTEQLRRVIESGLSQLLRHRWAPGPRHLFRYPGHALGGVPPSPASLVSRNDFVQHAGSAFLRWADRLKREREGRRE